VIPAAYFVSGGIKVNGFLQRLLAFFGNFFFLKFPSVALRLSFSIQRRSFAWHVFFGRNSFPDIDSSIATSPAPAELAISKP
jgi:hypothetical protein